MKNKNEISVLIMTYDGFSELWQPLLKTYRQLWKNMPESIYISNNNIIIDGLGCEFISNENEAGWSDNIIKALEKIKTKYVFCIFDDTFPKKNSKFNLVDEYIDECIDLDWDYLRIHNSPKNGVYFRNGLNHLRGNIKYRTSLNFTVIKREVMLSILNVNEDAWEFENNSVKRSLKYNNFFVVRSNLINYYNLVVKGKYNPIAKKYIEKQIDYKFDIKKIKKMNYIDIIKRKIHENLYALKRKIIDSVR